MKLIKYFSLLLIGLIFGSCSEDYTILEKEQPIVLTADKTFAVIDSEISFTATQGGENITQQATFKANDKALTGHTFTSNKAGIFKITATYGGKISETKEVEFHDGSNLYLKKRVLIEDYTGTWCGFCPRVAHAIDLVHTTTENIVPVAIHGQGTNSNSDAADYDPYLISVTPLDNWLSLGGYPIGYLNRNILWKSPEPENVSQVIGLTEGENPKLGLAMENTVNPTTKKVDLTVKVLKDKNKNFGDLKLVVYVLEDKLIYKQKNYTAYYNGENPITSFVHNHVLRAFKTNLLGDAIPNNEFIGGSDYQRDFHFDIPNNIENPENISFVAFVVDDTGRVVNVRSSEKNTSQDFERI